MNTYFLRVWYLYLRVSLIHIPLVLFSLIVVSHVAPLIEPDLEQPAGFELFLLFLVYSVIFIPSNLIWAMIVTAFPQRFYLRAGIALAIVFQVLPIIVGTLFATETPDFITWQSGFNMVLLSYGTILILGLLWNRAFKGGVQKGYTVSNRNRADFDPDWNRADN